MPDPIPKSAEVLRLENQRLLRRIQELTEQNFMLGEDKEALEKRVEQLEALVMIDPTSGVFNRNYLNKIIGPRIDKAIHSAQLDDIHRQTNEQEEIAVRPINHTILFIDLDNFKRINDTLGHEKGDAVLRACATLFKNRIQGQDEVVRYGGDEFILDIKSDVSGGISVAKRLIEAIPALCRELGLPPELTLGFSIGIIEVSSEDKNAEQIVTNADTAMYKSKKTGKNRFTDYRRINKESLPELTAEALKRGPSD